MFCLRTLRELKLLKFLSEAGVSENVSASPIHLTYVLTRTLKIISILDIIKPPSLDAFKEVYRAYRIRHSAHMSFKLSHSDPGVDGNRYAPRYPNARPLR
jgi:hypothetical protein